MSYLEERLYQCRDLLSATGSIFVQMGDENPHVVRSILDEVFGRANFVGQVAFVKTTVRAAEELDSICDHLIWYCRDKAALKYHPVYYSFTQAMLDSQYDRLERPDGSAVMLSDAQLDGSEPIPRGRRFRPAPLSSQGASGGETMQPYQFKGVLYDLPVGRHYSVSPAGLRRLEEIGRLMAIGRRLYYKRYADDFPLAVAVKVIDVYGNESTVVKELG